MSFNASEPIEPVDDEQPAEGAPEIDPLKYQHFMEQVKANQNLPLGFIAGTAAAVIAAIIWAIITVASDYQIGFMAVGVGFLVGLAVRQFGKGTDTAFGVVGAVLSLFGCLLGNLFTVAVVISQQEAISLLDVFLILVTSPAAVIELMTMTFSLMDLLFYGLAIYFGYKFSFRRFNEAELAGLLKDSY